tara:strand:- start:334 stop:567 length:234 start_codon:yes stop_codon:yes gene_type:complete
MKITISQLKQLIRETAEELNKNQTIEIEEGGGANIPGGASHGSLPKTDKEAKEEEEEEVTQRNLGNGAGQVAGDYPR